jgi:hypothetical protein
MKKVFVKPETKGIRLRENILAGSGGGRPAIYHHEDGTTTEGLFFANKCKSVAFVGEPPVEHIYGFC